GDVHARSELEDEPLVCAEADMRGVGRVCESCGRRVGQEDVDAAAAQARAPFELSGAPAHLALRVLVRSFVVADRSAQARDPYAGCRLYAPVDVDAACRSAAVELRRQTFECRIAELELGVVVARYVQQWHIGAADQVLQVVER